MDRSVSVVISAIERFEGLNETFLAYVSALSNLKVDIEYIFVLTPNSKHLRATIESHFAQIQNIRIIELSRDFGEATIIQMAKDHAKHELILTLPPYEQVASSELISLFDHIEGQDMVIARRWPRLDRKFSRWQTKLFNAALSKSSDTNYQDLGCGVRLFRKYILDECTIYGDQHRFLPIIANGHGFSVKEVDLKQASADANTNRIYAPGTYLRRILDLLSIVFLTKFNKKPLRFFGIIGASSFLLGLVMFLVVVFERFVLDVSAGDRPLLLISLLFVALGIQLAAIGLVGETIIFTHAKDIKEYKIKKIHDSTSNEI